WNRSIHYQWQRRFKMPFQLAPCARNAKSFLYQRLMSQKRRGRIGRAAAFGQNVSAGAFGSGKISQSLCKSARSLGERKNDQPEASVRHPTPKWDQVHTNRGIVGRGQAII